MMPKKFPVFASPLLLILLLSGCAFRAPLRIEPVSKKAVVITPKFTESYYYFDRDHNLFIILRSASTDKDTGKPVQQIAIFRVFWHPIGGKTSLNPTSLNATYRYILLTPDSIGMYEGAGFVRLDSKDGKPKMKARLLDGDLRLTEASANFVDTLGRARFRGAFTATYNDARALDMLLAAHREFFSRSLVSKPGAESKRAPDDDFYEPSGATPDTMPAPNPSRQP